MVLSTHRTAVDHSEAGSASAASTGSTTRQFPASATHPQIALPIYTLPQITLDDCALVREEIGSNVFERYEITRLKALHAKLPSN